MGQEIEPGHLSILTCSLENTAKIKATALSKMNLAPKSIVEKAG
jgi:hypothetical protein